MTDIDLANGKRKQERQFLNRIIDKPVEFLVKHNASPNLLSYSGFIFSFLASLLIALGFIHTTIIISWIPTFLILISGIFDVLDGAVARKTNTDSSKGAFLDSNIDRVSDAVLILGLIYGGLIDFFMGYIILFLTIMISYSRARAEVEGVNMKGIGVMERAERMVFLIIGITIEIWVYQISYWITNSSIKIFYPYIITFYLLLLLFTIGQRFIHTYRSLKNFDS